MSCMADTSQSKRPKRGARAAHCLGSVRGLLRSLNQSVEGSTACLLLHWLAATSVG